MTAFEPDACWESVVGVGAGLALGWLGTSGAFRLWSSALASGPGDKATTGSKRPPDLKPGPALLWLLGWKTQIANNSSNVTEMTTSLRIILGGLLVLSARVRNCEKNVPCVQSFDRLGQRKVGVVMGEGGPAIHCAPDAAVVAKDTNPSPTESTSNSVINPRCRFCSVP